MRELSLFTGAGGGILGSKLLGWTTVGYVEWEPYCQKVIAQRINDGIFDNAPIFGDIRAFIDQYANRYRGLVDIVTGGFPCQPFSVAGKQLGADDPRNMWPETIRAIRTIRPKYAFLENVPGLIISGYFGTVLSDLHEMGYNVRWCVLSASDVGAPHKRDRLWIFAYSNRIRLSRPWRAVNGMCTKKNFKRKTNLIIADNRWPSESGLDRMANGVANRAHRLKAIGNGQVPLTMALAFSILSEGII